MDGSNLPEINSYEIGVIGAGPSGSTAASYLADYGFNVCLIEKKKFPRETLCGEFLSAEVIHLLKEQNLFDEFISLKPNKINLFRFFNSSGKSIKSNLNFSAYGLSRALFDNLLLCNSVRKGVKLYQPAEVKKINKPDNAYELIIETEKREIKKIRVKYLIAAYGKQNPLDNLLKRKFVKYKSRLNGIKFHISLSELKNINNEEIQIYAADNIYCGVNLINDKKVTFCFLEKRTNEQPAPRKQLLHLRERNKAFGELFDDENLFDDLPVYGTGNIYFGKRNLIEDGIFMIGDAAGVIAPLAGDGIGMAMESGKLIADLFFEKRNEHLSLKQIQLIFSYKWEKLFRRRIKNAMIIQNFILFKYRREAGFILIKTFPHLISYLIGSTRNLRCEF